MKNWMKALPLLVILFSGTALGQELELETNKDLQQQLEDRGQFYWATKPAQCSSSEAIVDLMKRHNENPTVWMEGITGMPNGTMQPSKHGQRTKSGPRLTFTSPRRRRGKRPLTGRGAATSI